MTEGLVYGRVVASHGPAGGRTASPAWRACRPPSGHNSTLALWTRYGRFGLVIKTQRRLSAKDREQIHVGLAQGKSGARIGEELGRDASVINREIARHGRRQAYSGVEAHARASRRPAQAARNKIADTPALLAEVRELLAIGTTPKQIEVALRRRHGLDTSRRVSHETIYDFIYVHAKRMVKKELIAYLRRKKPRRSPAPPRPHQAFRPVARSHQHRRAASRG